MWEPHFESVILVLSHMLIAMITFFLPTIFLDRLFLLEEMSTILSTYMNVKSNTDGPPPEKETKKGLKRS